MPVRSAGILLYRRDPDGIRLLLVHPGGPFWKGKDDGAWMIPKGLVEPGEDPLAAALREFEEEMGSKPSGGPTPIFGRPSLASREGCTSTLRRSPSGRS